MHRFVLVLVAVGTLVGPTGAGAQRNTSAAGVSIDTMRLRAVSRALAHDSLGGRETGSPGAAAAASYIADRLREMGLQPTTPDGAFTRPVPIRTVSVDATSRLTLRAGPDSAVLAYGPDFVVVPPDSASSLSIEGEVWFLGTGGDATTAVRPGDPRGRVLAVLGGLPEAADSILDAWAANGAAAVMVLLPDSDAFAAARRQLGATRYELQGATAPFRPEPPLPVIVTSVEVSRALLQSVSVPPRVPGRPFEAVRLAYSVSAAVRLTRTPVDAVNVVAIIPGSDPARRDELVVYTAHYDHIGMGQPDESGDSIYNGFSDNAAGVAMVIAIAEALRREPPARSVAFLFLTGEERGLLGSTHAAAVPPWPGGLARVRALINLDGGAPPVPPVSWRIAGGLARDSSVTPLGALADSLAHRAGWTATLETARPNSDYWPFSEKGVPAILIIPGNEWEGTTTEERDALRKRWDRYHHPTDEYREDFPFSGLKRYAEFALTIGRALANMR